MTYAEMGADFDAIIELVYGRKLAPNPMRKRLGTDDPREITLIKR